MEPRFKIINERCRLFLPERSAPVRWIASNGSFYFVQLGNPLQCLFGNAGTLGNMDVKELAPDMSETGDFLDTTSPIKFFEPGIAVGMQPTRKVFEMISWPLASSIRRELVERGWKMIAGPIPLVS